MNLSWSEAVLALVLSAPLLMASADDVLEPALCDALEVTNWSGEYDQLLCAGVESMDAGHYRDAIQAFERALAIDFFEAPNVQLFPRLALAYFKAGDTNMAVASLRKAELSLSVLSGVIRCVETDRGPNVPPVYSLVNMFGSVRSTDEEEDVIARMCWPTKSGFGGRFTSLGQVVAIAALVEYYFQVRDVVLRPGRD